MTWIPPVLVTYSTLVNTLIDSLHTTVFLLFGFTMMNVDIHFDKRHSSPQKIVKKMDRVMCLSRTWLVSQYLMIILWCITVLFMQYESSLSTVGSKLNIAINLINVLFIFPLNFSIYIAFWGMFTRLRKVFKVLQIKKVCLVIYTVLGISLSMYIASEISLCVEIAYLHYDEDPAASPFMHYFYYPTLQSMNIIVDMAQALTVMGVIKHIFDLKMEADGGKQN